MNSGDGWTWHWLPSVPAVRFADNPAGNRMGWRAGLCEGSKRGFVLFAAPMGGLPEGMPRRFRKQWMVPVDFE
jgi:hypothetical protein